MASSDNHLLRRWQRLSTWPWVGPLFSMLQDRAGVTVATATAPWLVGPTP